MLCNRERWFMVVGGGDGDIGTRRALTARDV